MDGAVGVAVASVSCGSADDPDDADRLLSYYFGLATRLARSVSVLSSDVFGNMTDWVVYLGHVMVVMPVDSAGLMYWVMRYAIVIVGVSGVVSVVLTSSNSLVDDYVCVSVPIVVNAGGSVTVV